MLAALTFDNFVSFFILGLSNGGIFALSALGLVVVYRATGVLNLAQGAIGAVGALTASQEFAVKGRNEYVGYVVALLIGIVLSLLYGVLYAPRLAHRDPVVKAIGTLGFALALLGFCGWRWTARIMSLRLPTDTTTFGIAGTQVSLTRLLVIAASLVVTVAVSLLLVRTRVGLNMRALANDRELASMIGVQINKAEVAAWLISGVMAGVTGLLFGAVVQLEPASLTFLVVPAIAAALVGQLKSLWWTLAGAMVIGVIQSQLNNFDSVKNYKVLTELIVGAGILLFVNRNRIVSFKPET
jgi:branched-chain amino acid transport system permease protein